MDPNNYEQPGLRLPEPLTSVDASQPKTPEKVLNLSPEVMTGQASTAPTTTNPTFPAQMPSVTTIPVDQPQDSSSIMSTTTPRVADDADLIEKEWVIKAKSIVERTKDDPHQQNSEMSHFKADYLKKRYNKDIKVSSES